MRLKMKFNFGKAAAYGAGAMVGGGLTWLGWRWLEGRGIDPMHMFKKKVEEGNRIYYDPTKDPDLDIDDLVPDEIDSDSDGSDDDSEDEDEDEEVDGDTQAPYVNVKSKAPYQIDGETWYHSEEDENMRHSRLTYYILDQQILDENNELVQEPWKLIGIDNYEELTETDPASEMFVRNEESGTDYVITKEEGSSDD